MPAPAGTTAGAAEGCSRPGLAQPVIAHNTATAAPEKNRSVRRRAWFKALVRAPIDTEKPK